MKTRTALGLIAVALHCVIPTLPAAAQCGPIQPHYSGIPGPESGNLPVVSKEFDEVLRVAAESYFNPRNELYIKMMRDQSGKMIAVVGHVLGQQRAMIAGDPLKQSMFDHWIEELELWMQGIVDYRCFYNAPFVSKENFWIQAQEAVAGLYEGRIERVYGKQAVGSAFEPAFRSGGAHADFLLSRRDDDAIVLLGQRAPAVVTPEPGAMEPDFLPREHTPDDFDCITCRYWHVAKPGYGWPSDGWYEGDSLPYLKGQTPPNLGGTCKTQGQALCCRPKTWHEEGSWADAPLESPPFGGVCYCVDRQTVKEAQAQFSRSQSVLTGDRRFCW